jgi:hypothetical protein
VAAVISRNGTITLNYVLKLVTNFAIRARLLPRTEIADDAVTFDGQEATRWFVGVMTACST